MCLVIGTTAENAATGASSGNVAAVEFVLMLLTMSNTVASVTISASPEFSVIMDFVVMHRFKYYNGFYQNNLPIQKASSWGRFDYE